MATATTAGPLASADRLTRTTIPAGFEQVGYGQRGGGNLHRVPALDQVSLAVAVLLAEHHGARDDQQDDPAGYAECAGREVQQPGQQAAEDQQEHGDRGRGNQHLAQDLALDRFGHVGGDREEGHQRDLGPDPDQEEQERVDDEGGVQRFEIMHCDPTGSSRF
jgi:hypothetical protein